jgi:uncharacterized protein
MFEYPVNHKTLKERAILFTRYPEPGRVKTRLIPALGPKGACEHHRRMTELAVKELRELSTFRPLSVEVRFEGGTEDLMKEWLGTDLSFSPQGQGDLGIRMERAFQEAFQRGFESVVLIGSDCPDRTAKTLETAFVGLKKNDLILGPARDGGYYLIGLKEPQPLFTNIPWGSGEVFNLTHEKAQALGLNVLLLETLQDIDRPEDLPLWARIKDFSAGTLPGLSVIIPTLNEAENISFSLARIPKTPFIEVIVADGGSQDGTTDLAASWGAKVLSSPRGRACQMNTAAGEAMGEIFLFLHADTRLPEGFTDQVCRILSRPEVSAGAFQLKFDPPLPGLGIIEWLANWRARAWQLPYGDQTLFLRAERFKALDGFSEIPIMEDVDLIRRLRSQGPVVIAPVSVMTSSRRWKNSGVLKTSLKNQLVLTAYFAGISPHRLARWYYGPSRQKGE